MSSEKRLGGSTAPDPGMIRPHPRRPHPRIRPRPVPSTPTPSPPPTTACGPICSRLIQGTHLPPLQLHILAQAIQLADAMRMIIQHHWIHNRSLKFLRRGGGVEVHFLGGHAKASLERAEKRDNKLLECHDYFVWKKRGK
jgi:hypothetical protein